VNELLNTRRAQMFPKLSAPQIARLESHGVHQPTHSGQILLQLGERRVTSPAK